MSSLTDLSATQALHLLQEGEISSLELTQAYLDRIQQLEPQIEAFITLTPELALELPIGILLCGCPSCPSNP